MLKNMPKNEANQWNIPKISFVPVTVEEKCSFKFSEKQMRFSVKTSHLSYAENDRGPQELTLSGKFWTSLNSFGRQLIQVVVWLIEFFMQNIIHFCEDTYSLLSQQISSHLSVWNFCQFVKTAKKDETKMSVMSTHRALRHARWNGYKKKINSRSWIYLQWN